MKQTCADEAILSALEKYADMVVRIAFQNLRSKADAEDVMQDVFIKLLQQQEPFENEEHRKAWLIRVTINQCRDYQKSAWRRKSTDLNEALDYSFTNEEERIFEDLCSLPPSYRNLLYLYYYEGYALREIAEMTGESLNTVGSRLRRARKRLKISLEGGN